MDMASLNLKVDTIDGNKALEFLDQVFGLEDDVFCGPSMVFTNVINPRSAVSRKHEYRRTLVGRGASIGANATILPGLTIGEGAMVGAGAVITKDVPPRTLVVGNPARVVRAL